jgi:hypothetical protein
MSSVRINTGEFSQCGNVIWLKGERSISLYKDEANQHLSPKSESCFNWREIRFVRVKVAKLWIEGFNV